MEGSLKRMKLSAAEIPTPFTALWKQKVSAGEISRPRSPRDYAELLSEWGYLVIPLYGTRESKIAQNLAFKKTLEEMPEYIHPLQEFEGELHLVKGGFGALGNPSSFHNPFVREKRQDAHATMVPIFKAMQQQQAGVHNNIEQIIDRMRVLRPTAQISAETWHRDTTPTKFSSPGDLIYGGWINFDEPSTPSKDVSPQLFSAFPKSHRVLPLGSMSSDQHGASGFQKASKEELEQLNRLKSKVLEETNGNGWYIEVPPGHMLVFQQEMVHEVMPRSAKSKASAKSSYSFRLFTAWRLTNDTQRFLSNQFSPDRLEVPRLKSGQAIDMWPQAAWKPASKPGAKAPWDTLEKWSETTFKPAFLEHRKIETGNQAGETKHIIPRRMYGMNDVSIKLQALGWIKRLTHEIGMNPDDIPEIYTDIVNNPPAQWRERWSDNDLNENFIDATDLYYDPYSPDDFMILTPHEY